MRFSTIWTTGLILTAILGLAQPAQAQLFHRHGQANCDAQQQTVRLPAQEIRVETMRPRVIVNEVTPRGYRAPFALGYHRAAPFAYAPQAYVASFYVPSGNFTAQENRYTTGSSALRAAHALEMQAVEVAKLRAAHAAEMAALDKVHQRIMANVTMPPARAEAPATDLAQIKTALEDLSKRVSDIERLLVVHDDILQKNFLNKDKK